MYTYIKGKDQQDHDKKCPKHICLKIKFLSITTHIFQENAEKERIRINDRKAIEVYRCTMCENVVFSFIQYVLVCDCNEIEG